MPLAMPHHCLITGGAGFIGSHIADALLSKGHSVRILDNLEPRVHGSGAVATYVDPRAQMILGDIRDAETVRYALEGTDTVIHAASLTGNIESCTEEALFHDVNVRGTEILCKAVTQSEGIKKVILLSSMMVYGEPQHLPTPESAPYAPLTPYAETKMRQEVILRQYADTHGCIPVMLRLYNVYGPRQSFLSPYNGVVAAFVSRILNGKPPLIFDDGEQLRDFVWVQDVASAVRAAVEYEMPNALTLNIGSGMTTRIRNLAELLCEISGSTLHPEFTHCALSHGIRNSMAEIAEAKRTLEWQPEMPLKQGLKLLLAWAAEHRPKLTLDDVVKRLCAQNILIPASNRKTF